MTLKQDDLIEAGVILVGLYAMLCSLLEAVIAESIDRDLPAIVGTSISDTRPRVVEAA